MKKMSGPLGGIFLTHTMTHTIHQRRRRTGRQTDGQTDRRHAIAIPRFALKCIAR